MNNTTNTHEVAQLSELLPRQLRSDNRLFINLLEDYYRFLNQEKNPSYVINRIIDEHDLDKVFDNRYLSKIKEEIAKATPTNRFVQKAFLLKRIVDVYNLRGNEESIQYFFRVFFNEDVQVYYPWERVIKPSQGEWKVFHRLKIILLYGKAEDLLLNEIEQINRLGSVVTRATVSNVQQFAYSGLTYFILDLQEDTILGEFNQHDYIRTADKKIFGKIVRSLDNIIVTKPGKNYSSGDRITLPGITESFSAFVDKVGKNGEISTITVENHGFASSFKYFDFIPAGYNVTIPNLTDVYLEGEIDFIEDRWYIKIQNDEFEILSSPTLTRRFMPVTTFAGRVKKHVALRAHTTSLGLQIQTIEVKDKERFLYYDFEKKTTAEWRSLYSSITPTNIKKLPFKIISQNEEAADADFEFSFSSLYTTSGQYVTDHGKPSGYGVLQDSFYYQVFSYEINSPIQVIEWRTQLDNFVHPAGLKGFGLLNLEAQQDLVKTLAISLDIDESFMFPFKESTEYVKIEGSISASTQSYNGAPEDIGPYFAEDYAAGASFFYDIIYEDENLKGLVFPAEDAYGDPLFDNYGNPIFAQLIFSVGTRTDMGYHQQGKTETTNRLLYKGRDKYNYDDDFTYYSTTVLDNA